MHHFLGADGITDFSRHCTLPFTVMGGIKLNHLDELLRAGAKRVAVVTAISKAYDIAKETTTWQQRIMSGRGEDNVC